MQPLERVYKILHIIDKLIHGKIYELNSNLSIQADKADGDYWLYVYYKGASYKYIAPNPYDISGLILCSYKWSIDPHKIVLDYMIKKVYKIISEVSKDEFDWFALKRDIEKENQETNENTIKEINGDEAKAILSDFHKKITENQISLDPEMQKVLKENFWDLF